MVNKILDKISLWLYERILTYELLKYFRANKYSKKGEKDETFLSSFFGSYSKF